ncbi:MAG: hypothetical protein GY714_17275 [Desulfobacterales bacterium]|nr:hypothetical protein [Desulfobacterales bacterium]
MEQEFIGLIFSSILFIGITIVWYFALFKGYDKIWSDKIIKFQSKFALFEFHHRLIKAWNRPWMIKIFCSIMLVAFFYALYLSIAKIYK